MKNLTLKTSNASFSFDKVLLTVDCPTVLKFIEHQESSLYWDQLKQVGYLGVICLLLIIRRKLSPFYVVNLLDRELPFTGIIEATNIVSSGEVGGKHIVYLPKYLPASDPMNHLRDDEIKNLFLAGLKKVYPEFGDRHILHAEVSRERYVQPLQELNYLDRTFGFQTPVGNLFMVNTSMIYNSTLNNNAAITLAKQVARYVIETERKKSLGLRA